MVDFANGNLCGASKELNDVLSKLADAKAEIVNKIDAAASEAAAKFAEEQNEINALTAKLQSVVIPKIPKLNLQAEISSLLSQVPGSVAYAVAAAKIALEFKKDIEAKGLTLDTLVAASAVASDLICKVVPNLEKEAGSIEPAKELPAAVKQADLPAAVEVASKVWQNPDIEKKTKELVAKAENFKTTAIPPVEDTPKFKLVPPSLIKTISAGAPFATLGNIKIPNVSATAAAGAQPVVVPPSTAAERKNYVPEEKASGFATKKSFIIENFSVSGDVGTKLVMSEGNCQLPLKHKPNGDYFFVMIYPGTGFRKEYIEEKYFEALGLTEPSSDANKQFYYTNMRGRHGAILIKHPQHTSSKTNWSVFGNYFIFYPPVTLSDHPGNIDSGGYYSWPDNPEQFKTMGREPFMDGKMKTPTKRVSDTKLNKKYKGYAVKIRYSYLEKYDPDYRPADT